MNELIIMYPIFGWVAIALIALIVCAYFAPSQSKRYRQDLTNMYVAGKIKQLAEKDDIDINAEFLQYAKITKNKKIDFESLDSTIERELQEDITEDNKKSTAKDKK